MCVGGDGYMGMPISLCVCVGMCVCVSSHATQEKVHGCSILCVWSTLWWR